MWAYLQKRSTVLYAGFLHIPVQYSVEKVLIWNSFMFLVESLFCWLVFPFQSLINKVLICSIYLLNNKNLECGHTSQKKGLSCYTQRFYIFLFNILLKKYWFETVSCFWSNLCFAGCFFRFQRLIKKVLICSIHLLNNKNLECGRTSKKGLRCYTQGFYIFLFNILLQKYWFETVSCFWSNLCFAGWFFLFNL